MFDLLDPAIRRIRLVDGGPVATGLSVAGDGMRLGACRLIRKSGGRFVPRGAAALEYLLDVAYGGAGDAQALHAALWPIARKLDDGDMPGAMIRALLLGLPDLPDETARLRLESAEDLFKAEFDPGQEREGPLGLSEGCITITGARPTEPDPLDPDIEPLAVPRDEPEDTIAHHYRVLHDLLISTPAEYLPGTKRRVYGVVDVVGPTNGHGR